MPYIKTHQRNGLDPLLDALVAKIGEIAGSDSQLNEKVGMANYCMSKIASGLLSQESDIKYWKIALISGVFVNAKDEFYRRVAVPYEENQLALNGDVY